MMQTRDFDLNQSEKEFCSALTIVLQKKQEG